MAQISAKTKFAYGLGQVGEQVKNQGFNTFLFFYFTQVLGLSGTLAGAAVLIALAFDAITDPIAGSISDNWKSSRGRRHPFRGLHGRRNGATRRESRCDENGAEHRGPALLRMRHGHSGYRGRCSPLGTGCRVPACAVLQLPRSLCCS